MAEESNKALLLSVDCPIASLPDHLLIEIFIHVPIVEWGQLSCVNKYWADLFRQECLWRAALIRCFPLAGQGERWPGPIPRGMSKRRFIALYMSKWIFPLDDELSEIVGHSYLFLKEQLEISTLPPSPGILHGTIIDQFISCGKSRDRAHEVASLIWLAVIENLEDNDQTFILLKRLALEGDKQVFVEYPYSRWYKVEWKILERLFTDFRDCLGDADYYHLLASAKHKFHPIPPAWLGY
ncbi:lipid-binding serum glycoprotein family protein [Perilla frutescens var. hirtella]|nr:lipid-binding serum glycoprotein family protein [Perilla frutescens var. frutescens]KAH6793375.1 lipid-binding serum glycoprotein family protein [Perilla frutescens var. hirtella]